MGASCYGKGSRDRLKHEMRRMSIDDDDDVEYNLSMRGYDCNV